MIDVMSCQCHWHIFSSSAVERRPVMENFFQFLFSFFFSKFQLILTNHSICSVTSVEFIEFNACEWAIHLRLPVFRLRRHRRAVHIRQRHDTCQHQLEHRFCQMFVILSASQKVVHPLNPKGCLLTEIAC